jgi:hypothetical protein
MSHAPTCLLSVSHTPTCLLSVSHAYLPPVCLAHVHCLGVPLRASTAFTVLSLTSIIQYAPLTASQSSGLASHSTCERPSHSITEHGASITETTGLASQSTQLALHSIPVGTPLPASRAPYRYSWTSGEISKCSMRFELKYSHSTTQC